MKEQIFTKNDCIKNSYLKSYKGQMVLLNLDILKPEYRTYDNQLWIATSGFGCEPEKLGTKVFVYNVITGKNDVFRRNDFLGIVKDEIKETITIAEQQPLGY